MRPHLRSRRRAGHPVDDSQAVDLATTADEGVVADAVEREFADLDGLTDALVRGEVEAF